MNNNITALEEIMLLKRCFCEFFVKLLPTLRDPQLITRQRWHSFREMLLDEFKTTKDLHNYVKELNFTDNATGTTPNAIIRRELNQQPKIEIEIPQKQEPQGMQQPSKDMFVKQPSRRKLEIKSNRTPAEETTINTQPEYQKVDLSRGKGGSFGTTQYSSRRQRNGFGTDQTLQMMKEAISMFRKDGTTLGMVYNKSFEINTSDFEKPEQQQSSIGASRQAHQDLVQLQNAQRNGTLKGYSIYAQKDKEIAKQKFEQFANTCEARKIYF